MAAKNVSRPTLSTNYMYDRRRAIKIAPLGEKETLQKATLKAFIAALRAMLPPSGLTTLRRNSDKEVNAILASPMLVDGIIKKSPIEIAGQKLSITPAAPRSTKIWIYSPSYYIPKEKILEALRQKIETTYIEEIVDEFGFPTERLFAYVRGENIPAAVFFGTTRLNITYPGMERRCRLCDDLDHAAGNCPKRKCYNCNKLGHVSAECTAGCRRCGSKEHSSRTCTADTPDLHSGAQFPELHKKEDKETKPDEKADEPINAEKKNASRRRN